MFRRLSVVIQPIQADLRLLGIATAVVAVGLGVGWLIVSASEGGNIKDSSGLLVNLAWIALGFFVVLAFRHAIERLLANAREVSAGPFTFKVGVENVRVPAPGEDVRLANVALLHTSFLRPDKTAAFGDGRVYYQVEVVIAAPDEVLDRVERVTYRLDSAYPDPARIVRDRSSRFKLRELANGTSIVTAEVEIRGQASPVRLNRFIDLRPTGPRI